MHFVRYFSRDAADQAMLQMHGKRYGDNIITVADASEKDSFFTQDTDYRSRYSMKHFILMYSFFVYVGFITNQKFDTPKAPPDIFDSSLPSDHYPKKRKEEPKNFTDEQSQYVSMTYPSK